MPVARHDAEPIRQFVRRVRSRRVGQRDHERLRIDAGDDPYRRMDPDDGP